MAGALTGKRVLVTRNKKQSAAFAQLLKREGAEPIIVPLLTFKKKESTENMKLLSKLHDFSWLFFTSANGVRFFFDLMEQWNLRNERHLPCKVAAVGSKTARMLKLYGINPDFQPTNFNGKALAKEFLSYYSFPGSILIIEGNLAKKDLCKELEKHRVNFQEAVVYDTLIDEQSKEKLSNHLKRNDIDIYTFTSPSTVESFDKLGQASAEMKETVKREKICVCIGKTTRKAAEKAGFQQILIPEVSTIEGMIDVMKKSLI